MILVHSLLAHRLQTTVDEVRHALRTDRVIVFCFEPDWKGSTIVESVDADWTSILATTISDPRLREQYVQYYQAGNVTVKVDIDTKSTRDGELSASDPCYRQLMDFFQVKASLVVPILTGECLWGLLIAHHCVAPRSWSLQEIDWLKQLATQLGSEILQYQTIAREQGRTQSDPKLMVR